MIKIKGMDKNPEGTKSGVGGTYAYGTNPYPGGDLEILEVTPGTVRLTGLKAAKV